MSDLYELEQRLAGITARVDEQRSMLLEMIDAPRSLMTEDDLAKFLKIHVTSIQRLKRDGKIPFVRIKNCVRFNPREVLRHFHVDANT